MKPITPLITQEYFAEITQNISKARKGDRVLLMTMTFDPKMSGMMALVEAIEQAAEQGAETTLIIDTHSFMFTPQGWPLGPVLWKLPLNRTVARYFQHKLKVVERLQRAGCSVEAINAPQHWLSNPYGGRSHTKLTIINDTAYLGGCNLSGDETIDMMLRLDDAASAQYLYERSIAIKNAAHARKALSQDVSFSIDDATELLLDHGKPGQSLIYDQALKLIDDAREYVAITCQFFPDSRTISHLKRAARRGVRVDLYFNDPAKQDGPTRGAHALHALLGKQLHSKSLHIHTLAADTPHLHLKLIATEQGAIVGSHNYVNAGVRFGTAEIALLRLDQGFSEQLIAKVQPLLK